MIEIPNVENFFNLVVRRLFIKRHYPNALSITITEVFGLGRKDLSTKGFISMDSMHEGCENLKKSLKEKTLYAEHIDLCSEILNMLNDERIRINIDSLSESDDKRSEKKIYNEIKNEILTFKNSNDEKSKYDSIKYLFCLSIKDAYYITRITPQELQYKNIKKECPDLLKKITESIKNNDVKNPIKDKLASDKCHFDFSNKNYVIHSVGKKFIPPFNIFIFNDYCYKRSIAYVNVYRLNMKINGHASDKTLNIDKEFKTLYDKISYILYYICTISDEEKIKDYLNFIPKEILPDKNRLLDYIKTLNSFSFSAYEKIRFIYAACIDIPLLNKYTKLKRDLMEQVILPKCTFNEALEWLSDLFVSCRMFGNLDGLIVYDRSILELKRIGEEKYNLRRKYGIFPPIDASLQENLSKETEYLIKRISVTSNTRTVAIDKAMLFVKSFKTSAFEKGIEIAENAVLQFSQFTDEEYKEKLEIYKEKEFELKCMDEIEQIVSENANYTRVDAINIAQNRLNNAKSDKIDEKVAIYERVVKEFKIATDDEFALLQKQIFS